MIIDEKLAEGYVLICDQDHSFLTRRLGISVECPCCGEVALTVDLAAAYYNGKSKVEAKRETKTGAEEKIVRLPTAVGF